MHEQRLPAGTWIRRGARELRSARWTRLRGNDPSAGSIPVYIASAVVNGHQARGNGDASVRYNIVLTVSISPDEDRMSLQYVRHMTAAERRFLNYNLTEVA